DDVLQVYDISTGELRNSGAAVTPCRLPACDPRLPYRVFPDTVKFLTLEGDQGADLNNDGDRDDLVVQVLNFRTGVVRTIGTVNPDVPTSLDPLQEPVPLAGGDPGTIFISSGRCIETLAQTCCVETPTRTCEGGPVRCPAGATCEDGICVADHGVCKTDSD